MTKAARWHALILVCVLLSAPLNGLKIYGLMVTRSDYWVMHTWLAVHAWQFEQLVVLDGTRDVEGAARIKSAATLYDNVIYANEQQLSMPETPTDNSLRNVAWSLLPNSTEVVGSWIVIAHPDEFYLQRFSDLALKAEADGANVLSMSVIYALPYAKDRHHLEEGVQAAAANQRFNVLYRLRYCVSNYHFREARMYKYESTDIRWGDKNSVTIPEHFPTIRQATWTGSYVHYKIHNFDKDAVSGDGIFVHSLWSAYAGNSADIYVLDEKQAEPCVHLVNNLCPSLDPPCKMYVL